MGWLKPESVGKSAWRAAGRKQEVDDGVVAILRHPVRGQEGAKIQEGDVISGIPEAVGEAVGIQGVGVRLDQGAVTGRAAVADIRLLHPTDRGVPDVPGIMIHRDNQDHLSQDRHGITETAAALDEEGVRGTMTGADRIHAADVVRQQRRAPELDPLIHTRKDGKKLKTC